MVTDPNRLTLTVSLPQQKLNAPRTLMMPLPQQKLTAPRILMSRLLALIVTLKLLHQQSL